MQSVPRQLIKPDHLYDIEIDSLYVTVKHLSKILCNSIQCVDVLNVIIKLIEYCCNSISNIITLNLPLNLDLKINLLKIRKFPQNIKNKFPKPVLLNQQNISRKVRSYFDNYRNDYIIDNYIDHHINSDSQSYYQSDQNYQKNRQLVIYQDVNYGISILTTGLITGLIIGKVPLSYHHINLSRNILPKLVPKICQRIQTITYGTVGLTPG